MKSWIKSYLKKKVSKGGERSSRQNPFKWGSSLALLRMGDQFFPCNFYKRKN